MCMILPLTPVFAAYVDIEGTYKMLGTLVCYSTGGVRQANIKQGFLVVTTQADDVISAASIVFPALYLEASDVTGLQGANYAYTKTALYSADADSGIKLVAVLRDYYAVTTLRFMSGSVTGFMDAATDLTFYGNVKFKPVVASGTWTVTEGLTTVVVDHGLGHTPVANEIAVWFDDKDLSSTVTTGTYTGTQFTVTINVAASAGDCTGHWASTK